MRGPDDGRARPEPGGVRRALPTCEGCHSTGSRGYFVSLQAFESLVVYNPKEVVAGKPDESQLILLLEGKGTLAYKQMPISGPTFADIAAKGGSSLTMLQIRDWVTKLQTRAQDKLPSLDARRITRIGAADVQRALYQQLGLSDADFFQPASSYSIPHKTSQDDNNYPLTSPDSLPAPYEQLPVDRFASLGGGSAMVQLESRLHHLTDLRRLAHADIAAVVRQGPRQVPQRRPPPGRRFDRDGEHRAGQGQSDPPLLVPAFPQRRRLPRGGRPGLRRCVRPARGG